MADTKISDMTDLTTLASGDEVPVADASDLTANKSFTLATLTTYLQTLGMPRVKRLDSQHSIASTTGTKVTGLDLALEAGTYTFKYTLMVRSAATADGPQLGINFTGTASTQFFWWRFPDATTALTAEVHIQDNIGVKTFGYVSGMAHNAFSTTSPNMGTTVGVTATGVNLPVIIEGLIIVTATGNIELWEAAESTNAATVEIGSSLVVVRTDLDPT
jgi:hypothetical protein